jgi:raffinose/stachyose/melibiose transport system permease protein
MRAHRITDDVILFFLVIFSVFAVFPVAIALLNSLKTNGEILNGIMNLPARPMWRNYGDAFIKTGFFGALLNTVFIASVGLAGIVLFSAMAGYKLSRTRSRLSDILFGLFIFSMLLPFHSYMISLFKVVNDMNLKNNLAGLGFVYVGLGVAMAILLYHGFVKSIPYELDEAAWVEGCGDFRLFFSIIFPLLKPITATVVTLNLLWIWNDFLLPMLVLGDSDKYTILLSINMLFGQYNNNDWAAILSSLILAMLPVIMLFVVLQKSIIKGISDGALKG